MNENFFGVVSARVENRMGDEGEGECSVMMLYNFKMTAV